MKIDFQNILNKIIIAVITWVAMVLLMGFFGYFCQKITSKHYYLYSVILSDTMFLTVLGLHFWLLKKFKTDMNIMSEIFISFFASSVFGIVSFLERSKEVDTIYPSDFTIGVIYFLHTSVLVYITWYIYKKYKYKIYFILFVYIFFSILFFNKFFSIFQN